MRELALIVHNVRSAHNVGSILRTADGLGVDTVYLSGYTPYPSQKDDDRLPHIRAKIEARIHKTALGAEKTIFWKHASEIEPVLADLRRRGFEIVALEQTEAATPISGLSGWHKLALIVGSEVGGLEKSVMNMTDRQIMIPMSGSKESFNVAIAAAIAIYHLKRLDS
ncbi:TrmH family RNA methyltransferase [Candidatus Saccharibacteria bacterium]|nr:TrmH family RNA methyltransferase [Candidatus Saccharibacteria bacterium]